MPPPASRGSRFFGPLADQAEKQTILPTKALLCVSALLGLPLWRHLPVSTPALDSVPSYLVPSQATTENLLSWVEAATCSVSEVPSYLNYTLEDWTGVCAAAQEAVERLDAAWMTRSGAGYLEEA